MKRINKFIRSFMLKWALKNFPLAITTKTIIYHKVFVKKGKLREWRVFNGEGIRIKENDNGIP